MNTNSTQVSADQSVSIRLAQNVSAPPSRDVVQTRVEYLTRRHGLTPTRAIIIAHLHFGEARA